jgi:hypothetical protein
MLEGNRPFAKPRHDVISGTPPLHEREMAKTAAPADALAAALKHRSVADLRAVLAARTGMAAFGHATISWLNDPGPGLGEYIDLAERELKALLAAIGD